MKRVLRIASIVGILVPMACEPGVAPSDLAPIVVVQGYLWAGHPVDSIVLSRTVAIDAYFTDSAARISGADVELSVDGHAFKLRENAASPGAYTLSADSLIIQSEKRYDLTVHALGAVVTASTVVPDTFVITTGLADSLQYPVDINLTPLGPQIVWRASPNRTAYGYSVEALDTLIYQISGTDTVWNRRVGSTPTDPRRSRPRQVVAFILQLKAPQVPLVWDLFHWYGRHRLTVFAMDTNFVDFMQMQSIGGRQYLPQLTHVQNGIGVFGSAAIQRQEFFLKQ